MFRFLTKGTFRLWKLNQLLPTFHAFQDDISCSNLDVVCHKAMTNQRYALLLSCEVPGEDKLPGATYNAEKLSKVFRRAHIEARSFFYGRTVTLDRAKQDIQNFFFEESEGHILYGIFHGSHGAWKLSDGNLLSLDDILEQWDLAKQRGTTQQLLIVSDACDSGFMVEKAKVSRRPDIAVQASCRPCAECFDDKSYTFTELLLWHLQGHPAISRMDSDKEKLLRTQCGPCYYCPDPINYGKGWVFISEHHIFGSLPLTPDSSETWSRISAQGSEDTQEHAEVLPPETFAELTELLPRPPPRVSPMETLAEPSEPAHPMHEDAVEHAEAPEPTVVRVPAVARVLFGRVFDEGIHCAPNDADFLCRFFLRARVPFSCSFDRGRLTFDQATDELKDFFSIKSERHILYGIFYGRKGSWELSDGSLFGLDNILEQWDLAKQRGTVQQLLIVSDCCYSGFMVQKATEKRRTDIAVQASCFACCRTSDMVGYTFTELLLWHLQGRPASKRMDSDKERALLQFGPCYYCPDPSNYGKGWVFISESHIFGSFKLRIASNFFRTRNHACVKILNSLASEVKVANMTKKHNKMRN